MVATPPVRPTKRAPGSWNLQSVSQDKLSPEIELRLPWLSPDAFNRVCEEVAAYHGFSTGKSGSVTSKRPDLYAADRGLALDSQRTRRALITGIVLGVSGVALFVVEFAFLFTLITSGILAILIGEFAAAILGTTGLTIATQSKWEGDVFRVRLLPKSTRPGPKGLPPPAGDLAVGLYLGRVRSSSTSTKSGTYRSLKEAVPGPSYDGEARAVASELLAAANREASALPRPLPPPPPLSPWVRQAPSHLVPLMTDTPQPIWYAYGRGFPQITVMATMVSMMLIIFGVIFGALPLAGDVTLSHVQGQTEGFPADGWSPTGSTAGTLFWNTFNVTSNEYVRGPPVTAAICPGNVVGVIEPSVCTMASGDPFITSPPNGISLTVPNGWHVIMNVTGECEGCSTTFSWSAPDLTILIGVTGTGVVMAVVGLVLRQRERKRAKSQWPSAPSSVAQSAPLPYALPPPPWAPR